MKNEAQTKRHHFHIFNYLSFENYSQHLFFEFHFNFQYIECIIHFWRGQWRSHARSTSRTLFGHGDALVVFRFMLDNYVYIYLIWLRNMQSASRWHWIGDGFCIRFSHSQCKCNETKNEYRIIEKYIEMENRFPNAHAFVSLILCFFIHVLPSDWFHIAHHKDSWCRYHSQFLFSGEQFVFVISLWIQFSSKLPCKMNLTHFLFDFVSLSNLTTFLHRLIDDGQYTSVHLYHDRPLKEETNFFQEFNVRSRPYYTLTFRSFDKKIVVMKTHVKGSLQICIHRIWWQFWGYCVHETYD